MRAASFALLILFSIVWMAPFIQAAVLPILGLSGISVLSGIITLLRFDLASSPPAPNPCCI